jgi:hypothetical protein
MSTQDPNKDIRRILGLFFLTSREKPAFKVMEDLINRHHAEINLRMLGTKDYPCPDIDHFKELIGDNEQTKKFIDWLLNRRAMPALKQSIHDRMNREEPSFIRVMFNPGERVEGGNDGVLQNLRNQITALSTQYAEAVGKLQEEQRTTGLRLSEITHLRKEKASLEANADTAKVAAASVSDAKVAGLEADKRSLQERISRLEERINRLEEENADLVKKSEKTNAQLKEQQENLDDLERLINDMTLEKNVAKDTTRVDDGKHAAQDNDGHNRDEEESDDDKDEEESDDDEDEEESDDDEDEEESDDDEDEEASNGNEEGGASDGNEGREGKQDTLSLLGNAMQKFGNVAASAASGVVGFVTTGVTRAAAQASEKFLNAKGNRRRHPFKRSYKKTTSRKTATRVTSQPGGSGGMDHKRPREDAGHSKSKKPRLDGTNPKRSRSNDGGAGPSDGKKHCPA